MRAHICVVRIIQALLSTGNGGYRCVVLITVYMCVGICLVEHLTGYSEVVVVVVVVVVVASSAGLTFNALDLEIGEVAAGFTRNPEQLLEMHS